MIIPLQRLRWAHIVILVSFILAVGLRTYKWNEVAVFNGDDGMDLSIVWNMEYGGHRPLVGPFLSVPDVYTPPTYYYLTWIFYHLSPSPDGVRLGYLFMDLLNMVIVMYLVSKIRNLNAAAIAGIFYAASLVLTYHGRAYWQPFPIQIFLSLTLLSFWFAYRKKSAAFLWLAALCYALALSVYPSPILLLPLTAYHLIRWHITTKRVSLFEAINSSIAMFIGTTTLVFTPQLIFEYRHGFPTLYALSATNPATLVPDQFIQTIFWHIITSITNFVQIQTSFPEPYHTLFPVAYILLFILVGRLSTHGAAHPEKASLRLINFFPPFVILTGYLFVYFIPDPAPHRVWALMPVFIVATALITEKALRAAAPLPVITAGILVSLYLYGNISSLYRDFKYFPTNFIGLTKQTAHLIIADMNTHKIPQEKTDLVYMLPENSSPHYELNRVLYWLIAAKKFYIPLTTDGNKLDYEVYMPPVSQPTVYLLCEQFVSPDKTNQECIRPFLEANPSYAPTTRHDHPELSLIILKKRTGEETIGGQPNEEPNKQW